MTDNNFSTATEPFARFWTDLLSRMGPAGMAAAANPSPDAAKQMQRTFFDAFARYCDEFMRSEAFLKSMRETMDRSLAFKKQMDQFLTQAHRGMQSPAKVDFDDLSTLLRNIEQRLLARLAALEDKVAAVEDANRTDSGAKASRAPRPAVRDSTNRAPNRRGKGGRNPTR